jgi:ribonuclease G
MQSAFVDIGLERDSFLYVSDFFEDTEEYDKIVSTAEEQVARMEAVTKEVTVLPPAEGAHAPGSGLPATNTLKYQDRQGRSRRSRRGRLRGKQFDDATPPPIQPVEAVLEKPRGVEETPAEAAGKIPTILPGESLAKYRNLNLSTSPTDPADEIPPVRSAHVGGPAPELEIEAEDEETEALDLVEDPEEEREPEEEVLAQPKIASLVVPKLASETPVTAQDSSHSVDKPFVAQGFSEPRRRESPSVSGGVDNPGEAACRPASALGRNSADFESGFSELGRRSEG